MRHGLQLRVCLGPDFGLWLTPNRPGALAATKFLYDSNKITYTKHFLLRNKYSTEFEWECCRHSLWRVFSLQTESLTNSTGVCSGKRMGATFWTWDAPAWLPPGFVRAAFVLIHSLSLFGANKLVHSLANLSAWGFQSSNVICVPCWNWLLLPPSAGFHLCTISQMLPCAGIHITFLPVI